MQEREFTQEKRGPLLSVCLKFFLECIGVLLSILVILIREYAVLKMDLAEMEHHILTEMGFKCHCEHPYDFILSYLNTLKTPHKVRQEAWNLANDGLRTTLCIRFKSEVIACAVVYSASRRLRYPLPENPPWWEVFDTRKSQIDEVCRVRAKLYSLPKPMYMLVHNDDILCVSSVNS
ncbi:hypothetical protein AMTR_s00088p00175940 [Amborella trichopoda]|uniref:Cyclin-like domain-containing protein n=1 Tax=Amborella trichopoda TaxID=13333 RepID=W1NWE0_AMBTC|nr:hypothetical protein AMTR_s00088p00175940 [Amborella trichopoda]